MNDKNVVDFNGITKLDLCPDRVLEKGKGILEGVVIMGYTKEGNAYFASKVITGRLKHNGNDIATFRLGRDSFAFFGGNWFSLDTILEAISRPWSGGFITQFDGSYYSAFSDKFGKFGDFNTDYGERITRSIKTGVEQEDGEDFSFQVLELGISQGFNASTGEVGLRTSDDNVLYGDTLFESTGFIGEYEKKLTWNYPGGLGTYPGFMGIEIFTTDDINFSSDHLILK